jgi:hypothetical protein
MIQFAVIQIKQLKDECHAVILSEAKDLPHMAGDSSALTRLRMTTGSERTTT